MRNKLADVLATALTIFVGFLLGVALSTQKHSSDANLVRGGDECFCVQLETCKAQRVILVTNVQKEED